MEIFHNRDRSGYEEIVSYGPRWWTEYLEMDANYRFAGWTLDLMAHFLERIIKNQYPLNADEQTIELLEKLLHIEHDAELQLDDRRRIASVYYGGYGHLNKSVLKSIIKAYTGNDGDAFWKDGVLCIEFNNNSNIFASVGILQKIIERRVPAHIPFQTMCTCKVNLGLLPKPGHWQKCFTVAGTVPNINIGLGITREEITLNSAATVFQKGYAYSGELDAGTAPVTSVGYEEQEGSILPNISTKEWAVTYQMCGTDGGL